MTTFFEGMLHNEEIKPTIMKVAKVGLGEKSEENVEIMKEILASGKECLEEMKAICER